MKKISLTVLAIIILLSAFIFYNNNSPKLIISSLSRKSNIKSGELVYRVNLFGVIPAADAILKGERLEEHNGQKAYHLSATANSLRCWAKMFAADAVLDSYIDTHTYNPMLFRQKTTLSNGKNINKEVLYDQKSGIMTVDDVKRSILPNTQDPLSLVFNIRHMDFDKIKEFETNINTNQKNYIFKATTQTKNISVNKKTYKTIFLKAIIRRRDKSLYHQSQISIVLLKDKENIPVLIRVFSSGILINARLVDIQ